MGESMANATIIIRCNDDDEGLGTTQHVGVLVSVSLSQSRRHLYIQKEPNFRLRRVGTCEHDRGIILL